VAILGLNAPTDIPWTRLCVSDDMIDRNICDREFPFRWRSSVTVFSYQPAEEYQIYAGKTVTYLKVVCTITGFQPNPDELGLRDGTIADNWNDAAVIEDFRNAVGRYYPCHGAILEVAVGPPENDPQVASSEYPYFADFEPKKRELYEIASETGEVMSRSLESVNVRKGATTSQSHEVVDMTTLEASAGVAAGPAQVGASVKNESGTRDITQHETTNIKTSDEGRELRELYSHTTQITQMYHQFNSYHLGTNRAVFFMLPRPHIMQSKWTFAVGPRQLEGIQEVFLVVVRPKSMKTICVDAYLETAHRHRETFYEKAKAEAEWTVSGTRLGDGTLRTTTHRYTPPEGWEIDVDHDGGYEIGSGEGELEIVEAEPDHLRGEYAVHTVRANKIRDLGLSHRVHRDVTVHIQEKVGTVDAGYRDDLWITGRGVCCCAQAPSKVTVPDSLVLEIPIHHEPPGLAGRNVEFKMTAMEANRMREEIGEMMIRALNHPDRNPIGAVGFAEGDLFARRIADKIEAGDHPDNHPISRIKGLDSEIRDKVARVAPKVRRADLLRTPLREQVRLFGLTHEEARKLRRAALGIPGPAVLKPHAGSKPE